MSEGVGRGNSTYIIGKKSNKQKATVGIKLNTSIKKSMFLKGTSEAKLLSGRIRFIYGFICEGFKRCTYYI